MYEQLLLFPERAEYLAEDRFDSYRVSLEHWRVLAETFREAFETVYERRSARVLLVHGGQGHGKSLFVRALEHAREQLSAPEFARAGGEGRKRVRADSSFASCLTTRLGLRLTSHAKRRRPRSCKSLR